MLHLASKLLLKPGMKVLRDRLRLGNCSGFSDGAGGGHRPWIDPL